MGGDRGLEEISQGTCRHVGKAHGLSQQCGEGHQVGQVEKGLVTGTSATVSIIKKTKITKNTGDSVESTLKREDTILISAKIGKL